jgi:ATP-dependent helicase/DNAse subunit B
MDGSEKMPLLVTGQSEKPRCFKHLKSLPCMYCHNRRAWMTCALFMEFLTSLERMAAKNWKMLVVFRSLCTTTSLGIPDMLESIIRNLWELEIFISNTFER